MSESAAPVASAPVLGARHVSTVTHTARFVVAYIILFAISQWPLYAAEHPDITDFPNHLARFYILRHLADSSWLQTYYAAAPHAIFPNLAMDIAVPLLSQLLGTVLALKVFASASTLVLTAGTI